MPTGETASVALSDIIVERSERVRRELDPKRVADLADSISRIGLIHFPVVRRDGVLVSGETRLEAVRSLGWDRVTIQWADTLTDTEHLEIELEENIKRTDLSWRDQCDAMRRYHELKVSLEPSWTQAKTAESIGVSAGTVTSYLQVAAEIASGNERVIAAPKMSTAKGIVRRKLERASSDLKSFILEDINVEDAAHPFLNTSFHDWVETYSGPPFNLIHCDFPYGINADKFNQGAADSFGGYKDDFDTYAKLIDTLIANRDKLMGESCHIIFWFSMKFYTYTLERLCEHFRVDPYPLVWHKSDNKGTLPDPERGPRRVYEVAFLCSYGDRKITSPKSNLFSTPTIRTGDHMSEKSAEMIAYFFGMLVDENTRLLDPTSGSGSALRAARTLGVGNVLGLEQDPEFFANAVRAWNGL